MRPPILFAKRRIDNYAYILIVMLSIQNTILDFCPLLHIKVLLFQLKCAQNFSHLDLREGYYHVPIANKDIYKMAFSFMYGTFEYLVLLFGLMNALIIF